MKISCYTTRLVADDPASDTRYLMDALRDAFDVELHFEADPRLSGSADVIFDRFPLPMNRDFARRLDGSGERLVINRGSARLRFGSKRSLASFSHLTAPTLVSSELDELRAFVDRFDSTVLKPVSGHKGEGVIRLASAGSRSGDIVRSFLDAHGEAVAQVFVPDVLINGDKRINVFGFEVISAVTTLPARGSFICHESSGGAATADEITPEDERILEQVVPFLREHDIWWAGIDLIGPYLGEINVTTPTMIRRADEAHGSTTGRDLVVRKLTEHWREISP